MTSLETAARCLGPAPVAERGDDVERPNPWKFTYGDLQVAKGWEKLCQAAPSTSDDAWVAITSDPKRTDQRQHQLKGTLSTGKHKGKTLPQWQYEVTGGGRVWYLVDADARQIVMTHAGPGHPGATDKGKTRKKRGQTT